MRLAWWSVALAIAVSACSFSSSGGVLDDGGNQVLSKVGFLAEMSLQDETSGQITVPVTLNTPSSARVTVAYEIGGGNAENGSDYTGAGGTLTFEPGELGKDIPLEILPDMADEQNETIELRLKSPAGADLAIDKHVVTISANRLSRASIVGPTTNALENVPATLKVFVEPAAPTDVTIEYAITGDVTAEDYAPITGSFVIPANTPNFELPVTISDDALDEFDEVMIVTMTGSPDIIITSSRTLSHTIQDNDQEPTVGFASLVAATGETGTLDLAVTLSARSGKPVQVNYTPSSSTDVTYSPASPLMIPAGSTSATLTITIVPDAIDEDSEDVVTTLDSATNATVDVTARTHVLRITDDDDPPVVSFKDCDGSSTGEPVTGKTPVPRTIALSAASSKTIVVNLVPNSTGNNADEGSDYDIPASVTINPGQTSVVFNIDILSDLATPEQPQDIVFSLGTITNGTAGNPSGCLHVIDPQI